MRTETASLPRIAETPAIDVVGRGLQISAAFEAHARRRLLGALRPWKRQVRAVRVQLLDVNGPRRGPSDKVCRVSVSMRGGGRVLAAAGADDAYASVERAAQRTAAAVERYLERRVRRPAAQRAARRQRAAP
jgi:ribosome-associated translation inhibitor RaiA